MSEARYVVGSWRARVSGGLYRSRLIHVVSFPKSGRTWLEVMTASVLSSLSGIPALTILKAWGPTLNLRTFKNVRLPRVWFGHGYQNGRVCQGGRFPRSFYRNQKVVLLVRNPRDVLVSHFHYLKYHYGVIDGSLSDFIQFPYQEWPHSDLRARGGIMPIVNYLKAWDANADVLAEILVMHYEDLVAEPLVMFRRFISYLDIEPDERTLSDAIAFGSFENMRELEADPDFDWHGLSGGHDKRGWKTRQGRVGSAREALSPDEHSLVDGLLSESLPSRFARYLPTP